MGCLSSVLPAAGTAVGTLLGGPAGGAIGGAIGSAFGNTSTNSGGGPSGGFVQSAFGTPNNIYSRNPAWVNSASETNYNNASAAANRPYQAYTGEQVAPITDNQSAAAINARQGIGRFNPTYSTITGYLNQSATPYSQTYTPTAVTPQNVNSQQWNTAAANQYMSPYLQAALQPQIDNINLQYAQQQNANNAAAAGAGVFGGDRAGVNSALINRQQNQDIQNVEAQGYNNAYNTALGAFQNANAQNLQAQEANQQAGLNAGEFNQNQNANAFNTNYNVAQGNRAALLNAASGLNGLVNTQQGVTNSINNNLLTSGAVQQQTQQAQDTANYQDFLNKLYYPEQQASYLQGLLGSSANAGSMSTGFNSGGNSGVGSATNAFTGLFNGIGNAFGGSGGLFGGSSSGGSSSSNYSPLSSAGIGGTDFATQGALNGGLVNSLVTPY